MNNTDAFEKMEHDGWADPQIAQGYADGFDFAARLAAKQMADAVEAGPGVGVLDLCTGHGVVAVELLNRKATVTGLDFSPAMIALAQKSAPGATFVQGDAMAMTFPDDGFDAVTIGFGVPHFPDTGQGLREAARVLKPGGRIAFSIWRGKGSSGAFGWLFDAVERLGDPSVTLPAGPDAHMMADIAIAEPILTRSGFSGVKGTGIASQLLVSAPEALFDAFDKGAVRAASLLGGQSSERRDAIRADLAQRVRSDGRETQGGFLVPAPSVVISAMCS
ncbi:methyltransferase domain-containing protein [Hoeflea prorocentri]|uniref:Methyltransferase domain-containing protein n=1 Tax=Hoeflea prorocentri TaxID=1922333 RepID=A0A9X3ZI21_9HYPH|nr:methyltransferase domain-containing protein [Hoeflea prorocentri]MCY6382452.1 methyltransferase domain-containing protein [Hoeflea prorocentri]MDA5400252.1 methyltransferase domain-containing protein [Hoeflea prorocentri]